MQPNNNGQLLLIATGIWTPALLGTVIAIPAPPAGKSIRVRAHLVSSTGANTANLRYAIIDSALVTYRLVAGIAAASMIDQVGFIATPGTSVDILTAANTIGAFGSFWFAYELAG